MKWIRIRVNVSLIGDFAAGEIYDVEETEEIHTLARVGFVEVIPYPDNDEDASMVG